MTRWFGYAADPTVGGTKYDLMEVGAEAPLAIPAPTVFVPATSAQANPNLEQLNRNNEVRGRRANVAPMSFAARPSMTLEARAYPKLLRKLMRIALGGEIENSGVAPAAITSKFGTLQSGNLPAIVCWLLREGQVDRMTGGVVSEIELNFPIDEEGTCTTTLLGLYLDTDDSAEIKDPNEEAGEALPAASYTGHDYTFMLRDAEAFRGAGEGVSIDNLAGFGLTFNNGLITDMRSLFRPNHNIEKRTITATQHKLWWPNCHKLGPQEVTGRIDLSDVDPDAELKHLLTHSEKLVFEVAAGPAGTTPETDEMMRLTVYQHIPTGGGAEPLVREGDQVASYEFTGYLDSSLSKDLECSFSAKEAVT